MYIKRTLKLQYTTSKQMQAGDYKNRYENREYGNDTPEDKDYSLALILCQNNQIL